MDGGLCGGGASVKPVDSVTENLTMSGNYAAPDAVNGRSTAVFHGVGVPVSLPRHYGIYVVNADEALVVSLDSRGQTAVVGEMRRRAANLAGTTH